MPNLVLNAAQIVVPDAKIEIATHSYVDQEHLRSLRLEYREQYSFRRWKDTIQAVAIALDAPSLNWAIKQIKATEEPRLIASLVTDAFLRFAAKRGAPSRHYSPVSISGGKNILSEIPHGETLPKWLRLYSTYLIETRTLRSATGQWAPFLVLDSKTSREISASLSTLITRGFDPIGRYVQTKVGSNDPLLAARHELVGAVSSIDGQVVHLSDTRGNAESFLTSELYLEPRDEFFDELLFLLLGVSARKSTDALERLLAKRRQADQKLENIRSVLDKLIRLDTAFQITPTISVTFETFLSSGQTFFPPVEQAPPTKFIFDVGKNKVEQNNRRGISSYGPYNWNNFTPSSPRIAVICSASHKGVVETYLRKFKDGVPFQPGRLSPYAVGFASMFRLSDVSFKIFEAQGSSPAAVKQVCQELIDLGQAGTVYDLVLLQNAEATKALIGDKNPYLVAKSILLKAGIASQSFLIEKTQSREYDLAYILADLAIAAYAKLGGTPWLISADHAIEHEIIIGVGSASVGQGRLGPRERIVGITSIFKGDGDYLLSNLSKAVPYAEYTGALTTSLRIAINQARADMNWKVGDGVRIVIHAFKPMSDSEISAVQSVVGTLSQYRVQFAFIHVKESHPYSLFDTSEPGTQDWETRIFKGKYCPKRGTFLKISQNQTLVSTWGGRDIRSADHGYPKPLLLELHPESTFTDQTYLARQLINFSSHSWRSFGPARTPVTILYSDLVASLLARLKDVDGWSADVLPTVLGKRRWFL